MPRHNSYVDEYSDGDRYISKQVSSSPSSASPGLKNYRVKRTILVARRRKSTASVPLWRGNARSPRLDGGISEISQCPSVVEGIKGNQGSVSARKLANALWECGIASSPKIVNDQHEKKSEMDTRRRNRASGFVSSGSLPYPLSKLSHSSILELYDRPEISNQRTVPPIHHNFHYKEDQRVASDMQSKSHLTKFGACLEGLFPGSSPVVLTNYLKELQNGLTSSKELVKLLIHSRGVGKRQSSAFSLATALYYKLDQALVQVDQLIEENKSGCNEISCLIKWLMEEKRARAGRNIKEQERRTTAFQSMIEELETEKRARRRAERIRKRLEVELMQMKASMVNTTEELKNERRRREIIEQVGCEIIRGVGEDKAEVEELNRESVKAKELEERETLQLADDWRVERVQIEQTEAKYQFEGKNATVNQLRSELETLLGAKSKADLLSGQQIFADCRRETIHPTRKTMLVADPTMGGGEVGRDKDEIGDNDGTDSEDSDLHSIELNLNNGCNWSHASGATEDEGNKLVLAKEKPEMSTDCEMVPNIYRNFTRNNQHLVDGSFNEGRSICSKNTMDNRSELRDQKLPQARIVLPCGLLYSAGQFTGQKDLENRGDQASIRSKVAEMVKAIRESESKANLVSENKVHSQMQTSSIQ